jgi:hypothetical protein
LGEEEERVISGTKKGSLGGDGKGLQGEKGPFWGEGSLGGEGHLGSGERPLGGIGEDLNGGGRKGRKC